MKKGISIFLVMVFCSQVFGQKSITMGLGSFTPKGNFKKTLSDAQPGGLSMQFNSGIKQIPKLEWGLDFGIVMYTYREYDVTFTPKGKTTPKTIAVYEDDCMIQMGVNSKYSFWRDRTFMPYATVQTGVNKFFSHIDPVEENTGYESKFKWQGNAAYAGFGIGTRVDLSRLFGNKTATYKFILDLSNTWNAGSVASYRYFKNDEAPHENLDFGVHRTATPFGQFKCSFGLFW